MKHDYAVHSDFLIYWTGKDIDARCDANWVGSDKSATSTKAADEYVKRLRSILEFGIWMTEEREPAFRVNGKPIDVPPTPKSCFTELKLSESRKHARQYGRLGIAVKRPFVLQRYGRPVVYYGFHQDGSRDVFLTQCAETFSDKRLLSSFKPMNSALILDYDYYSESEWRIIYQEELERSKSIMDPRDSANKKEHQYFQGLTAEKQNKLKYLVPLDGWFAMIIYPSLDVKNRAQQETDNGIRAQIERIKKGDDHGNRVEHRNWSVEVDLDACRNF